MSTGILLCIHHIHTTCFGGRAGISSCKTSCLVFFQPPKMLRLYTCKDLLCTTFKCWENVLQLKKKKCCSVCNKYVHRNILMMRFYCYLIVLFAGDPNDLVPINRRQGNFLDDWKSIEKLQLLNLVYDVTSPDLITMVITQLGNIPCSSVPVVLRISRTFEQM